MTLRHLARKRLLAFDGDELPRGRGRLARAHLAACPDCRARLQRLRALREAAAEVTAPPAPDVLERIQARIAAGEELLLPVAEPPGRRRRPFPIPLAAAAALLLALVVAGSAAAAIGVGPVRGWLRELVGGRPPAPVSGVEVEVPADGMAVELVSPAGDVALSVVPAAGALLEVSGAGPAATASFRAGPGAVRVAGLMGGTLRLGVPAGVSVAVRVDGVPVGTARADGLWLPGAGRPVDGGARIAELPTAPSDRTNP